MDSNGFSGVKIIGYEHNWNDAGGYPITLVCEVFYLMYFLRYRSAMVGCEMCRLLTLVMVIDARRPERVRRRFVPLLFRLREPARHVPQRIPY